MEEKRIRMHRQGCIHAQFSMYPVSNIPSLYGIKSTTDFSWRMMRKSSQKKFWRKLKNWRESRSHLVKEGATIYWAIFILWKDCLKKCTFNKYLESRHIDGREIYKYVPTIVLSDEIDLRFLFDYWHSHSCGFFSIILTLFNQVVCHKGAQTFFSSQITTC